MTHRMMARLLALGMLLAPPALHAQSADSTGLSIHFPDSIGAFARTGRKDFDDPSLGVMLRYQRADSLRVDVFVYPGPDFAADCSADCALKVIDDEANAFVSAFPEMVKRGYTDSISVVTRRALTPAADEHWRLARYLRLRLVTKGVVENSDYYLYYLPGFRVKLRASYPVDSANAIAVAAFSQQVIPAIVATPAVVTAADVAKHIAVNVTFDEPAFAVFSDLVATLVKQGYTIADSSRVDGRIVTAPFMGWPLGSEKEAWHGDKSPGVIIAATLRSKGDSTAVEISGRSPTVAGWTDTNVSSQLELISVIVLAGDLPKTKPR